MSEAARWMARVVWWQMLRFLRRPRIRRWRRRWLEIVPASTARRMIRQDRFARHHGRTVLAFSFSLLFASMAITGCYFFVLVLMSKGILPMPRR